MTADELDRLTALAAAATPGPWTHEPCEYSRATQVSAKDAPYGVVMDNETYYPQAVRAEDQAFCAAARDAVPALVAEVRRLRGALHQIARRDDAEMAAAKTLHYDMRGWAQRALDGAA